MRVDDERDRDVLDVLRALDHPLPAVSSKSIVARARHVGSSRRRWIAVLLTVAVGGVAYAAPGSPVKSWLTAMARPGSSRAAAPNEPPSTAVAQPAIAGLAVEPGPWLVIEFGVRRAANADSGTILVTLVDSGEVIVRSPNGAATFASDVERLGVDQWDPTATFDVLIPRSAPHVEIRVAGTRVFLKDAGAVATRGVTLGPDHYRISFEPR